MYLEPDLKKRVIEANRGAQLELYYLCFNTLISVAKRYEKNEEDIETLVNDSFIRIIKNLDKYIEGNFEGWIKKIITNIALDSIRKNKKESNVFSEKYIPENLYYKQYYDIDYIETKNQILKKIEFLPKKTKQIFIMFIFDEFSRKEISDKLNISIETVKWHMGEARLKLKKDINLK